MKRPDVLLLANAIMGQFLSGFASRIFIVSLPTIANTLHADIIGISWALIAYQLAGISLSVVFGRIGDVHGRYRSTAADLPSWRRALFSAASRQTCLPSSCPERCRASARP